MVGVRHPVDACSRSLPAPLACSASTFERERYAETLRAVARAYAAAVAPMSGSRWASGRIDDGNSADAVVALVASRGAVARLALSVRCWSAGAITGPPASEPVRGHARAALVRDVRRRSCCIRDHYPAPLLAMAMSRCWRHRSLGHRGDVDRHLHRRSTSIRRCRCGRHRAAG